LSAQGLAPYGNRLIRPPAEDPRRRTTRRAISWTLVALVHLLFFAMLTMQIYQKQQRIGRRGAIETILDLSLLRNPNAPEVNLIEPEVKQSAPPEVTTAPITITPPKPKTPEQEQARPATPGDVLKAVGEDLACGAANFENLTDQQRARCRRQPWLQRKLPDGTIVLLAPPKQQDQEQPTIHLSGADQLRHDMQTSPACPLMLQVPCVDDMFHGRRVGAPQ
jgi:hypothetical protein